MIDKECSGDFRDVCIALLKDHLDFDVESVELLLGVNTSKKLFSSVLILVLVCQYPSQGVELI